MITCPSCGAENLDAARFCMNCTTPLAAAPPLAEERKVVTSLFCDLVGFTAMSEAADPEDVDALLRRYHGAARKVIESHGGTVEKFIGDAVVGVFGVPAVHEDDPERAVRAGLRIVEALEGMTRPDGSPLQVRVGINTGEALVRLDVTPGSGEGFLTGDAVNVAARLQAAAPPGGVAVGAATRDLTTRAIDYGELGPIVAKGKSAPVGAFLARTPIARVGIVSGGESLTPLVDRETELAYLESLFEKAVTSASPQIVVIVGEPGIGKSRLVAELYAHVDAHPEMTTWRQGCCLSCGDAVTFWALAGIVKAHAGILETDDRDTVETKLDAVLPEGEDREWLRQRLRALLGLEAPQASREENFNAWLRFLEEIAVSGATVLVLEDLHWAEDALLAFLEYAASNVAHVSLLLVATTRPELFESHPSFAASGRINRVVLEPLSEVETETLVASLLGELPMDVRETIARRAQGNPFYAEESARLVKDRVRGGGEAETTVAVAASVRAVIAARLDALPPEMKAALADAAVVGQTFWDGALAALDDRPLDEVEACLQGLMERQLVHRVRSSSMAGEHEFAFEHALARDVVYGALPRRVRAEKHTHVAAWLEAKAGEHLEDISDQLTHHRVTAFELAQASGQDELVERLRASTVTVLGLAGRRTMRVDIEAAERLFAKAVELCADDDDRRAALLDAWARSLLQRGRFEESRAAFEEAFRLFLAQGRSGEAAVAMTRLINGSFDLGAPPAAAYDDALALIADEPDGEASATVMTEKAGAMIAASDYVGGLEWVQRASEVYRRRGMDVPLTLQSWRAQAECGLGELAAADRLLAVIRAMRDEGLGRETAVAYVNAQVFRYPLLGTAAYDISDEGLEFARSRGITEVQGLLEVNRCYGLFVAGSWADALSRLEASSSWLAEGPQFAALFFWDFRARILVSLGRGDEAICDVQRADELAQQHSGDPGVHRWVRCGMAEVLTAIGQQSRATEVLNELADWPRPQGYFGDEENIPGLMRCALRLGEADLAEQLARGLQPGLPLVDHVIVTAQALLAWANGEHEAAAAGFADAVIRWQDFGMPYEKAQALLGQGRCLLGLGKVPEAAAVLERAREIFSRLGAKPALAETNELMLQLSSA